VISATSLALGLPNFALMAAPNPSAAPAAWHVIGSQEETKALGIGI